MTELHDPETRKNHLPRRTVLKGGILLALTAAADEATRPLASDSHPTKELIPGYRSDARVLSVFHAGVMAESVQEQTAPLWPVVTRALGDTALYGYEGKRYNAMRLADETATDIAQRLRQGNYSDVIFNPISMGGVPAYHALQMLRENRTDEEYSARLHMTSIDAITSRQDLVGVRKQLGLLSLVYTFGELSNLLPLIKDGTIPLTRARDEVASFAGNDVPAAGSLQVDSLVVWRSMLDHELVDGDAAQKHWTDAVTPATPRLLLPVDIPHAAVAQAAASRALIAANDWHLSH